MPTPAAAGDQAITAETVGQLEQVAAFDLPDSFVTTLAFTPDSRTLIAGDRNGQVLMWDRETWEETIYLPARSSRAADNANEVWYWGTMALSPDGNTVVTAYGDDGVVTGRDRDGQELFTFSYGVRVYSVAFSPNGQYLAVAGMGNNVIIFDLETMQQVADLTSDHELVANLVFSPDGKTLLAGYERPQNMIIAWDTATWQETAMFAHTTKRIDYHDILFTPDGQELVIATTESIEIRFMDIATERIVKEFSDHTRAPYQLAFSPDGSLLASASDDGTLRFWDLETDIQIKTIRTYYEAGAVAFSPDGTLIAVSVWGKGVQVWAVAPVHGENPAWRPEPSTASSPQGAGVAIDAYLQSLEEEGAFSGAVLVAREGQVLLSKGYGLADREEGVLNTPQTKFRLYSASKQFTAMAILILQDQGMLAVRDHLCDHMVDCPSTWEEITLHQLLVHTSGIPSFTDFANYEATKHIPATPLEIIDRFRDKPLDFPPGREWDYSNSGYILLGYIIEQVSSQPYDAFIQEHIFQPLGMVDSGYDHNLDDIARGYTGESGRWRKAEELDMSLPYAAGALYSTVEDMYRWDQALYTEQLVPQALLEEMFTPFAATPIGGYGYGWIVTHKHTRPVIRHGGGGDGFITLIERYPDDQVTIIALSNRETADLGTIVTRIGQEVFRQ